MRKILSVIALCLALCLCFSACAIWDIPENPNIPSTPDTPDTPSTPDNPDNTENPDNPPPEVDLDLEAKYNKFIEIFEFYQENHLYDKEREEILLDTIKNLLLIDPELFDELMLALTKSEDDFSSYFTKSDYYDYTHQKQYSGIGVTVRFFDGYTQCSYVNPDGPAAKAGVMAGDIIYSVDGQFVAKHDSDQLVSLIKGEAGTDVEMGFWRPADNTIRYFTITRGDVYSPTVTWEFKQENGKEYAVVAVADFTGEQTFYEFVDFINESITRGVENVIIDLRNNPGGNFNVCLEFINLCIPEKDKLICSVAGRDGEILESYHTTGMDHKFDNLIILVNEASASAAELYPIVLQEYGLAKIVGAQTFGKAVGQEHFTFEDGDVLALTTFELVTPNGVKYHGRGVIPDIIVENPPLAVPEYSFLPLTEDNYQNATLAIENDAVKALSQRLVLAGVMSEETSFFGNEVRDGLLALQKMLRLEETGRLDKATFDALTELTSVLTCIGEVVDEQMNTALKELLSR